MADEGSPAHLQTRATPPQLSAMSSATPPPSQTRRALDMFKKREVTASPPAKSSLAPPVPIASTSQLPASTKGDEGAPAPLRKARSKDELASLALSATLTELDMEVAAAQTLIFEIQELRHAASAPLVKPTGSPPLNGNGKAAVTSDVDDALMRLDVRLDTLGKDVEAAVAQAGDIEAGSVVAEKLESLQSEWQRVQADVEMLREELKEDKWLVVFRTVGQQADEMMDSLERVLSTCHAFIWDVNRRPRASSSSTSSAQGVAGRLAASRASGLPSDDPESTQALLASFVSLHRSFHSKQKYYVPSTDRVLNILGKGINERSTRNGEVLRRYADMKARWRNLQDRMGRVEREMAGVEEMLREAAPPTESAPTEGAPNTPSKGGRSVSARSVSQFSKLAGKMQGKPVPPLPPGLPAASTGLPGTPSSSSSASGSPDRFSTWKRSSKSSRPSAPPEPPSHRYTQSATVTPRLTSSFFGPGEESPSLRSMSPPLSRSTEKPRWNSSTKLEKGEDKQLPFVAKRQSSYAFLSAAPPSRARSPVPSTGRRTPRPSSPSAMSAVSGRSVSYGGTYKPRPSSPSRIPQPGTVFFGGGMVGADDPDASEELPTSLMQRALSPIPSSSAFSTSGRSHGPRSSISPSKPDQRTLLGYRNMVQTPEPSLSARARRIEGMYAGGGGGRPSQIGTPTHRPRVSGVVSPTMLDQPPSGPYTPNPRDPLDVEVANVVNRQPLRFTVVRVDPPLPKGAKLEAGESVKYSFAGERTVQVKLVERVGKPVKVMARVGGLWQDLELTLLNTQASLG